MSYDKSVSDHYLHGNLLNAIKAALVALDKTTQTVTIEDLAPVDEFHIGGRIASDHLLEQMRFQKHQHILDVGCGLGGAARYVASQYKTKVSGIDLTAEYIETGKELCNWLNLTNVKLIQGSALDLPFNENTFDGAYMLHVGMNIEDKVSLFKQIYNVLKPGTSFGVYDIMRQKDGELTYPVPWATTNSTSKLATPEQYQKALTDAGFSIKTINNRHEFAIQFFQQLKAKIEADGGPPPLGLHTLMQQSAAGKVKNMIENIGNNLIAPVEIIAEKP
ncbi:methyltransferase domain-containing protein [Thalassotalea fonticola]|uniref:Methyltransferase domain-containing protein n=1 Tax=Thalassotalea fonticola TaxID=3065649 RepID=A0ABZ0GRJ1_9GAMM|nr:methyltransferase domain-containing protein [Colwelliaceae bacterium S1-1]